MKGKQRLGIGCKSIVIRIRKNIPKKMRNVRKNNVKKTAFWAGIVRKVLEDLKKAGGNRFVVKDTKRAVNIALKAAHKHLKALSGKRNIRSPRIVPIPKFSGILPVILTGLSALSSAIETTISVVKAVNDIKATREQLNKANCRNRKMKSIVIGKSGKGFMKPYRLGL